MVWGTEYREVFHNYLLGEKHCMKLEVGEGEGKTCSGTVLVNTVDFLK